MMVFLYTITAALRISSRPGKNAPSTGKIASFEEIYKKEFAFAWRTMRGLGVEPAYIDDAVQDVFIVVHRRLSDLRPGISTRSWVFGIVRRVARDYRRSQKRKGVRVSLHENLMSGAELGPHESASRNQALKIVEEFAGTLDEQRRAIFVLSELEQMPVSEIAATLGLNPNTIYSRLKVMKRKLKDIVSESFGAIDGDRNE